MANLIEVVDMITMRSLRRLINRLQVAEIFNTDQNKEYQRDFAIGETLRVKLPQRYLIRDGIGWTPQPIDRRHTTVTMDQIFGVDFSWDDVEAALRLERGMDEIEREYIAPAIDAIAQEVDSRAALWAYLNTNNVVGILGTNPTDTSIAGAARQRMIENACPPGEYRMIVTPGTMTSIVNGGVTLFNDREEISKAFKEGYYGRARQFDWYESMSLYSHTSGVWAGTVETSSAGQSGSSLALTATTGDTFLVGDVFNIAGVFNVNPSTRRSTGTLKQFRVVANVTAAASAATITIDPPIVGPGSQYQNVSALPGNGADLTMFPGTAAPTTAHSGMQNLALHRDAFMLVSGKLALPKAVEFSSQKRDPQTGITIRLVKAWDVQTSSMKTRFDVLMGFGNAYNDQCAVRVLSAT